MADETVIQTAQDVGEVPPGLLIARVVAIPMMVAQIGGTLAFVVALSLGRGEGKNADAGLGGCSVIAAQAQ